MSNQDEDMGSDQDEDWRCPECDSEIDEDSDACTNELCAESGEPPSTGAMTDAQERQAERSQLGIGG